MREYLKVTEEVIEKLKNNTEETRKNIEDDVLSPSFWMRISECPDLSEEYAERFRGNIHWNSFFLNNQRLTVELLDEFYLPLLQNSMKWTTEPYDIIRSNPYLTDDVLEWLIIHAPEENVYRIWCYLEMNGKEKFFWNCIFRNSNLTEEFRSRYNHLNPPPEFHVGDKVHVCGIVNRGIIGGTEDGKYIIVDIDHVYKYASRVVHACYSNIRFGWVR